MRRFLFRSLWPLAVIALVLGGGAVLLGIVAGLGVRMDWWHYRAGFGALRWAAQFGVAALPVGLVAGGLALWARRWRLVVAAALGVVLGAVAVGVPASYVQVARTVPPIHDISTDLDDPPAFVAVVPLRAGAPNPPEYPGAHTAAQQRAHYTDLAPARFRAEPAAVFAAAEKTARAQGWRIVAVVPEEGRIEASATTRWFGFVDDVVVRVRPEEGGGMVRVDVRSKSRVGVSDVGANARRIEAYLADLRAMELPAAE